MGDLFPPWNIGSCTISMGFEPPWDARHKTWWPWLLSHRHTSPPPSHWSASDGWESDEKNALPKGSSQRSPQKVQQQKTGKNLENPGLTMEASGRSNCWVLVEQDPFISCPLVAEQQSRSSVKCPCAFGKDSWDARGKSLSIIDIR